MADIDLTMAQIDTIARTSWETKRATRRTLAHSWDEITEAMREKYREAVMVDVTAALPHLRAALAEQVEAMPLDLDELGGVTYMHDGDFIEAGFGFAKDCAARIVRGGTRGND